MPVSLRDLRKHIQEISTMVDEAWESEENPSKLDFASVGIHARGILSLIEPPATDADAAAMAARSPKAANGTTSPKAADTEKQRDTEKRAAYARAAADTKGFDTAILGLGHIRR